MGRDSRTTEQIKGAISAEAILARQIEDDAMSSPQDRHLADELHHQMNKELSELDCRRR